MFRILDRYIFREVAQTWAAVTMVLLFILPPSVEELERRLRERGDTSEEDVERRLAVASEQIEDARATFDHLVVNDDLQTAIYQVLSILA